VKKEIDDNRFSSLQQNLQGCVCWDVSRSGVLLMAASAYTLEQREGNGHLNNRETEADTARVLSQREFVH